MAYAEQVMKKILVIDDNVSVRDSIVRILEDEGYQVVSAGDGCGGLALFKSEQPDLVITDMIMPEKDGIETIRAIVGMNPMAKIIAMSGFSTMGAADLLTFARHAGASGTLGQPFDPDQLTAMIQTILSM
jgi:CheY-like chemotaxis protein